MPPRLWLLVFVYFALLALVALPLGRFMTRVFAGENRLTARTLGPVERWLYRRAGVDPAREHTWKEYAAALLIFSAFTQLLTYLRWKPHEGYRFEGGLDVLYLDYGADLTIPALPALGDPRPPVFDPLLVRTFDLMMREWRREVAA